MSKYAIGTIVGTALVGLAKSKGSYARNPLNDLTIHNIEIPIVIGIETIFGGTNPINPFNVPQEVIDVWDNTPLFPIDGIQYRNLLIDISSYGMGGGTIGSIRYGEGGEGLFIQKIDGSPFTYEEIDETWMIVKTVVQNEIYNRAKRALRQANINWEVPYSLFMVLSGWEWNYPERLNLTTFGVEKQEYENWLKNPYVDLNKMEPDSAPAQYRFFVTFENKNLKKSKLRRR